MRVRLDLSWEDFLSKASWINIIDPVLVSGCSKLTRSVPSHFQYYASAIGFPEDRFVKT